MLGLFTKKTICIDSVLFIIAVCMLGLLGGAIFLEISVLMLPFIFIPVASVSLLLILLRWASFFSIRYLINYHIDKGLQDGDPKKIHLKTWLSLVNNGRWEERCWFYKSHLFPGLLECYQPQQGETSFKIRWRWFYSWIIFFKKLNVIEYDFDDEKRLEFNQKRKEEENEKREKNPKKPVPKAGPIYPSAAPDGELKEVPHQDYSYDDRSLIEHYIRGKNNKEEKQNVYPIGLNNKINQPVASWEDVFFKKPKEDTAVQVNIHLIIEEKQVASQQHNEEKFEYLALDKKIQNQYEYYSLKDDSQLISSSDMSFDHPMSDWLCLFKNKLLDFLAFEEKDCTDIKIDVSKKAEAFLIKNKAICSYDNWLNTNRNNRPNTNRNNRLNISKNNLLGINRLPPGLFWEFDKEKRCIKLLYDNNKEVKDHVRNNDPFSDLYGDSDWDFKTMTERAKENKHLKDFSRTSYLYTGEENRKACFNCLNTALKDYSKELSDAQLEWLTTKKLNYYKPLYRLVILMAEKLEASLFRECMGYLMTISLSKIEGNWFDKGTLFYTCIRSVESLKTSSGFNTLKKISHLFEKPDEDKTACQQLKLLSSLVCKTGVGRASRLETLQLVINFSKYYLSLGLELPEVSYEQAEPIAGCKTKEEFSRSHFSDSLASILDVLVEAGKRGKAAQQLQAQYAFELYSSKEQINYDVYKNSATNHPSLLLRALKIGYCMVHRCMFSSYYKSAELLINLEDFEAIQDFSNNDKVKYYISFRSLFFKYLALNVDAEDFKKAIKKWEDTTKLPISLQIRHGFYIDKDSGRLLNRYALKKEEGIKINLNDKVENELIEYARNLVKASDKILQNDNELKQDCKNNKRLIYYKNRPFYKEEHINDIIERVEGQLEPEEIGFFKSTAKALNEKVNKYAILSLAAFLKEAAACKDNITSNKMSLADCLALIRELNFRCSKEWLRPEQLLCVLMTNQYPKLLGEIDTSEGKTLVLRVSALLKCLFEKKKVDICVHQENLADLGKLQMRQLAEPLGLTVAGPNDDEKKVDTADIYYFDIGNALGNDIQSTFSPIIPYLDFDKKEDYAHLRSVSKREPDVLFMDEVEFLLLDFDTESEVQLSFYNDQSSCADSAEDKNFICFLNSLNSIVRRELKCAVDSSDEEKLKHAIQKALGYLKEDLGDENSFYIRAQNEPGFIKIWLRAAISAAKKVKKVNYNVEKDSDKSLYYVRIMHQGSGEQAKESSTWGQGVHCCLSAWERKQNEDNKKTIFIPTEPLVLGQGDLHHYVKQYQAVYGLTGTLRNSESINRMQGIIDTDTADTADTADTRVLKFPKAQRPETEAYAWPKVPIYNPETRNMRRGQKKELFRSQYNRGVRHPPYYTLKKEAYFNLIHRILHKEVEQPDQDGVERGGGLVIVRTIHECEELRKALLAKGMDQSKIKILDHTQGDVEKLRLTIESAIALASKPGNIIIATNIAGRGQDFKKLSTVIYSDHQALPGSAQQGLKRGGREQDRANLYEVYCAEKLDNIAQKLLTEPVDTVIPAQNEEKLNENSEMENTDLKNLKEDLNKKVERRNFRAIIEGHEKRVQERQFSTLKKRAEKRCFIGRIRELFLNYFNTIKKEKEKVHLANCWLRFFTKVNHAIYDIDLSRHQPLDAQAIQVEANDPCWLWNNFLSQDKQLETLWKRSEKECSKGVH